MTFDPESTQHERRQLLLMQARIVGFRSGAISLGALIADLEGLLAVRTEASQQWVDDFLDAWSDLEVPYAVALDRLTPIPDASEPLVNDGLIALEQLIASDLKSLP